MSGSKSARHASSIINRPTCGGVSKTGLIGGIGSVGTGGIAPRKSKKFCGGSCGIFLNTVANVKCVANTSNSAQSIIRKARLGMF